MRYDLEHVIGRGGMGEVYLGWARGEHGWRKRVAVKRIRPELAHDPEFVQRLVAEAKLTVTLEHANVVQVLDLGRHDDELFLVMELVDGADLSRVSKALGAKAMSCPPAIVVLIAIEVTKGLVFAHERTGPDGAAAGIIHCDVSPSNVLVSYSGEVKLADFGIAQAWRDGAARTSSVIGKQRYMPPERMRGEPPTPKTDLYALGVMVAELLQLPAIRRSPSRSAETIDFTSDLVPDVPPALRELVERLCASSPAGRPERARDVLGELVRIQRQVEPLTSAELGQWVRALVPSRGVPSRAASSEAALLNRLVGARAGARASRTETHAVAAPPPSTAPTAPTAPQRPSQGDPPPLRATSFGVDGVERDGTVRWRALEALPDGDEGGTVLRAQAERRRWLFAGGVAVVALTGVLGLVLANRAAAPTREPTTVVASPSAPPPSSTPLAPAPPSTPSAPEPTPSPPAPRHPALERRHARTTPAPTAAASATLSIYTDPWAHVFIDGQPRGTSPIARVTIRPGRHVIRLERPDMNPITKVVEVAATESKVVDLELSTR